MMQFLDVCICTHNPRRDVLAKVARALASQTAPREMLRVLVIDNCSFPPLTVSDFRALVEAGIELRIVQEPVLGLTSARLRAILETKGEWMLFIDDDNELTENYVSIGCVVIAAHPDLGCFGGKLVLPGTLRAAPWVYPLLPYLGIKDAGEQPITNSVDHWGPWEPPGAGAWVRRPLLNLYRSRVLVERSAYRLGRNGMNSLASSDDSMLMRGAVRLRLHSSYQPKLVLYHHLDSRRFRFGYLVKLLYSYGVSHVVLETVLGGSATAPVYYQTIKHLLRLCASTLAKDRTASWRYALCMIAYHLGAFNEYRRRNLTEST